MANPIRIKALVKSVVAHGEGVYSVTMAPEGRIPRFNPGQFLHLTVDEFDPSSGYWPESRVFSIASPSGSDSILIVYSVKGSYTRKMESVLAPGKEVWLKLPYGDFTVERNVRKGQDLVLVAGGTGITPFVPYLEGLAAGGDAPGAISLYYGVRIYSLMLFSALVARCIENHPTFEAILFVENGGMEEPRLPFARKVSGRLSIDAIYDETRGLNDPAYFLSGPQAMISSFRSRLADRGVALDNIKIDEWE